MKLKKRVSILHNFVVKMCFANIYILVSGYGFWSASEVIAGLSDFHLRSIWGMGTPPFPPPPPIGTSYFALVHDNSRPPPPLLPDRGSATSLQLTFACYPGNIWKI